MVVKEWSLDDHNDNSTKQLGLVGFVSILFAIIAIVDSIVHLVAEVDVFRDTYLRSDYNLMAIVLMTIRIAICLQYLSVIFYSKKYSLKTWLIIFSSFTYSIASIVIMVLSCMAIDFKNASISLICHLIASFIALVVSFKLLIDEFENNKSFFGRILKVLSDNVLAISTLFSVITAVVIGIIIREYNPDWDQRSLSYIGFIGEIFLRMLKCLVLPLIFTSLVFAMGDIDTKLFGKIGSRTVCYYLATTILAIILGIVLVMTIQPGNQGDKDMDITEKPPNVEKLTTEDTILDLVRYYLN